MKKWKVGIIGAGSISGNHMAGYQRLGDRVEVVACCDLNEQRAKEYAKKYNIPHYFTDYNQMLKLGLDAVSVTTWNNGHHPATIAALNAGVNVLCEKPPALSTEQAKQMQQAAAQSGKLLMYGFVRRFAQNTRILQDFIKAGRLGDIYQVKVKCTRRAGNPCGWFADKKRSGGGPLIDLGVHMIDLGRYLMGKPHAISVYGATFAPLGNRLNIKESPRYLAADFSEYCDVEYICTAMVRFDNGALLTLETSFSDHIKEDVFEVYIQGTKAGAEYEPVVKLYSEMDNYLVDITPVYRPDPDFFTTIFCNEIEHFIDCLDGKTECLNPPEDGVAIMQILDAIYQSAQTGHEVIIGS